MVAEPVSTLGGPPIGRPWMKCPRCQRENPADAVFCQECGSRLEGACPGCGTANRFDAKFCSATAAEFPLAIVR